MIKTTTNLKELIQYSDKGVLSKVLFKSGKMDSTLFCMSKGTEIDDHTSTRQGIVYVIEGNGTFKLEGKSIKMLPGVIIHMAKNAVHSLKAKENTSFLLVLGD